MTVKVIVKDKNWQELWSFYADNTHHLQEMASLNGIQIPISCWCWVCGICLCDVESGWDAVQEEKFWNAAYPLGHDENDNVLQVLTCIDGIKDEFFSDEKEHVLVLKRNL